MATEPIAKIRLPTHHPAIKDGKNGDMIRLHAKRVDDPMDEMMGGPGEKAKSPKPPPLETTYHVMAIKKHAGPKMDSDGDYDESPPGETAASEKSEKRMNPIDRLKAKRSMPTTARPTY